MDTQLQNSNQKIITKPADIKTMLHDIVQRGTNIRPFTMYNGVGV